MGICTADIIKHLQSEVTARSPDGVSADRVAKQCEHIINQRTYEIYYSTKEVIDIGTRILIACLFVCFLYLHNRYYPLFPPSLNTPVDYGHFSQIELPYTPDIMILPSDIPFFAKVFYSIISKHPSLLICWSLHIYLSIYPSYRMLGMYCLSTQEEWPKWNLLERMPSLLFIHPYLWGIVADPAKRAER